MHKRIPTLSEFAGIRYLQFIVLYFAQGIPEGMCFYGIPAWMAMNGKSPLEIAGIVAMYGLPWTFKIIIAPLMDRYTILSMGRKRPWVIFGQLGLIVVMVFTALIPDPLNNIASLGAMAFAIGLFCSIQDVATDGMAVDLVPVHQQARANGFMWGAKMTGNAVSLAVGTWLLNRYGFEVAFLMLGATVCFIILFPVFIRERPGEKLMPWTNGVPSKASSLLKVDSFFTIFKSLFQVFTLRNSLILAALGFVIQAASGYMDTLVPIFTVQSLGWSNEMYSQVQATAGLVGGIGGMLLGGIIIDKFGKIRMLNIYLLLWAALVGGLLLAQPYWQQNRWINAFMFLYQSLYIFIVIGFFAAAMQCCWKRISATQFTLYMTIGNIGRIFGIKMLGIIKETHSWQFSIGMFIIMVVFILIILQFLNLKHQEKRVAEIEEAKLMMLQ